MSDFATPVRRLMAMATDALVLMVITAPLLAVCLSMSFGNSPVEGSAVYWLTYTVAVLYTGTEVIASRSFGKRLWQMRIIDSKGEAPDRARRFVRWFVKFLPAHFIVIATAIKSDEMLTRISLLFLSLPAYSFLQMVFAPTRLALHDFFAGTLVVTTASEARGFDVVMPAG